MWRNNKFWCYIVNALCCKDKDWRWHANQLSKLPYSQPLAAQLTELTSKQLAVTLPRCSPLLVLSRINDRWQILTYPTRVHPCQLLLQSFILSGEQLGRPLRLLPPSALSGELSLEAAERLPERRLLLLVPREVGGFAAVRGSIGLIVVPAQRQLYLFL